MIDRLLAQKQAVIFDLDGTLVDSMWMWRAIDIEYLGRFGLACPPGLSKAIEGMSFTETACYFQEHFQLPLTVEAIKADWTAMSIEKYRTQVPLKKGARAFLAYIKRLGLPMGIAEYFDSLQKDKSLPQYNYATQQSTAPGSTYKMVVAAAGLSEGYITIGERIRDLGEYENISNKPKCWIYPSSHGEINVSEALRDSCNYFFYETGFRMSTANYSTSYNAELGTSVLSEYASMFGLDETTGIEIVENSPRIADDFPVMAAIGQSNNNFTTVQLARYVTAVANSGNVYKYTLLSRVEDAEGNVLQTYEPQIRNTVDALDASEWNAIHSGMRMVVENTREFKEFPITAAGKTGTAQENPKRPNHALFVGYAPYENPEISIATRIAFGYTSHNAAELSRNVFAYYFKVEDTDALLNGQAEDVDSSSNAFND